MASSSSFSPSAPALSSRPWKYDVFLSFRGEDIRKTFVDHLYSALEKKGIYTYKDDETLPRGNSIRPSLMKAIEESQIAVVIFSENYADSSWCLDELACIMKCKDTKDQIVLPIFYDVDPSEVRKQKRKYGEAFANHELENKRKTKSWGRAFVEDPWGWLSAPREQIRKYQEAFAKHEVENKDKVESWRKALVDASNIAGLNPKHIANGHEAKAIEEIVDQISHNLQLVIPSANTNLVGIAARVQGLKSDLQIEAGGVRMIGIWGVGGGGKTTLASSIFDEISRKFDGSCFVENIREESSKNGLVKLQKKLISRILKPKQVQVERVEEGKRMIMGRLCRRKVLIILDDVDDLEQLKALAGSHDWFGEGSRIIITTRDEHVLTAHNVDVIHNISLLSNDEAMKLFCKHAPRGHRPIEDYEQLSKEVVSYAGGLPLALRVLSCFLCDKEMNEWRSALARLKEIPDDKILEKLKISFDGLKPVEKELFLDIACFFRGKNKDEGVMILDACDYHPVIGITVLIKKALITITEDGRFDMHDMVQEMGHYIVRGEHPNNPEKHSRVWKEYAVRNICAMDATMNLDRIKAIRFRCKKSDESERVLQVAANMKHLRWIDLNLKPEKHGLVKTPLPLMPENFPPRELWCLTLDSLKQTQLWEGYKFLPNLRMIKLSFLSNLLKTPDFDGVPNLERFMVDRCWLLEEIHPSFGRSEKLLYVEIRYCDNLKMVPPITRSKKLETLVLPLCKLGSNLSMIQQNMENFLPSNMNHIGPWFFSGCLRKLNLFGCNLGDGDIRSATVRMLPNLQELDLGSNNFSRLDFSLLQLPRLKWLNVSGCYNLVELSELPSSIAVVLAEDCESLESFGDISNCKWLWKVSFLRDKKLGPLGDILLDSMLKGNAKDYFININLSLKDIRRFVPCLYRVETFTMPLPHDWDKDYCGVLMFLRPVIGYSCLFNTGCICVDIIIKQDGDKDSQSALVQESNETENDDDDGGETISVGYVSFSSLRRTKGLNATYKSICFSLLLGSDKLFVHEGWFRAVLVPKDDQMQTSNVAADSSEFWDDEGEFTKLFTVQHDSDSSIRISWTPVFDQ